MGVWGLVQIVLDIFLALGVGVCILRVSRRPQDDPRLSRALQLLQSKIAVLEDLSDQVDAQAARVQHMLAQKNHEVQTNITAADGSMQSLRAAVDQGIEAVRLAQSSLNAQDILEKKSSEKYAIAARLSHEGHSVDVIARELGLPRTEVEFISKVNRDVLRTGEVEKVTSRAGSDFDEIFATPTASVETAVLRAQQPHASQNEVSMSPLSRLGEEFRRVINYVDIVDEPQAAANAAPADASASVAPVAAASVAPATNAQGAMPQTFVSSKAGLSKQHLQKAANAAPVIRRVEFPRIDSNR